MASGDDIRSPLRVRTSPGCRSRSAAPGDGDGGDSGGAELEGEATTATPSDGEADKAAQGLRVGFAVRFALHLLLLRFDQFLNLLSLLLEVVPVGLLDLRADVELLLGTQVILVALLFLLMIHPLVC